MLALGGALGKVGRQRARGRPHALQAGHRADRLQGPGGPAGGDQVGRETAAAVRRPGPIATWPCPTRKLETKKEFVQRAFGVYTVFRQWLREYKAPAITVASCMGTIFGVSNTAACMPLSWLNDEGYIAFCESDFVVMPPGILLHYIAGKPVFMHNSTFPHKAMVTCAHCTAPRRMDGKRYEPARIMTHYESDFGAAPKVEMPIGQDGLRDQPGILASRAGSASRASCATTPASPSAAASRTWRSWATGNG